MEIKTSDLASKDFFKLMTATIVPRPIAWVSTVNEAGLSNLAPFSFFTGVCSIPPTILFCNLVRGTDGGEKDTLHNIRATGEFVINVVTEELAPAMNLTAGEYPSGTNEFEIAGLTETPSATVKPPRLKESPVSMECKLSQIVDVGDGGIGAGSIIIGEVLHLHIDDQVMLPNYKVDTRTLNPISRLAGPNYGKIGEIFQILRPASQVEPNGDKP